MDWLRLARRSLWNRWRHHEEEKCQADLCWRYVLPCSFVCLFAFTISIADFVNVVKSNSSRWVHESFATRKGFAWQEGYGAFSVSKSEERRVIRYIRNQPQHHAKRSFKDEFFEFLIQNKLEYDEKYL
jgi:putative transposase